MLRLELCKLCSDKSPSTLRIYSKESFKCFNWDNVINEFSQIAPTLLSLFELLTVTKSERPNRKCVIAMCISLLLKNRFAKACFIQKLISLILYSGHASKQVSVFIIMYIFYDCSM